MQTVKFRDFSKKERLFFIGDLHGDYKLFTETCKFLGIHDKDQIVSVGDLIDRGDQNIECLTHFLHADNCEAVMGNHDHFMVKAMQNPKMSNVALWYQNGGYWAENYPNALLRGLAKAIDETFPIMMLIEYKGTSVAVTHAEIPGNSIKALRTQLAPITGNVADADDLQRLVDQQKLKEECMWGRNKIKYKTDTHVRGVDLTVHGHTVTQMVRKDEEPLPYVKGNQHWIDTGAIFNGGRLTVAELVDGELQYTQLWYDENKELCIV